MIAVAFTPDYSHLPKGVNDEEPEMEFQCESKGRATPIQGTDIQMKELKSSLERGSFVSGQSTLEVASDARLPPGGVMVKEGSPASSRSLASYEGLMSVLAVRVTDTNGKVHNDTADVVADNIFGVGGDTVTFKSQIEACSFDKFQVSPYPHDTEADISHQLSAPGVMDVTISISLDGNDRVAIENAAKSAVEEKLGFELPGPFQHVMFILEGCYGINGTGCGWAAYAVCFVALLSVVFYYLIYYL